MIKLQYITRRNFEQGSNRPYAAMMYLGYKFLDSSVYHNAYYINRYGEKCSIHKIAVSPLHIMIILG